MVVLVVRKYTFERVVKTPVELYTIPFHIPRTSKQGEEVRNNVPLVLYESWKTRQVPKEMRDNIYELLKMNPEFDYYLYSDEDCAAFIQDNFDKDVVDAFHSLKPGAFKSDLWRYCILYKLGGVYLDIKYYSVVPLVNVIDEVSTIYIKDVESYPLQLMAADFNSPRCLYNGFIVSPPRNEVFKKCIDDIVVSCKNKLYKKNVLDVTGPCLLGAVVEKEYSKEYVDNLPFKYSGLYGSIMNLHPAITYKDTTILKIYNTYRLEQRKSQSTKHYSELYAKRDIYN
jgi:mannosyltransferase OCH1-like enzyme